MRETVSVSLWCVVYIMIILSSVLKLQQSDIIRPKPTLESYKTELTCFNLYFQAQGYRDNSDFLSIVAREIEGIHKIRVIRGSQVK